MANRNEVAEKYWGIDNVCRVPYTIKWLDNRFGQFLDKVYGKHEHFLDQIAAQVSIKPTGEIAKSHPTGGRVLVYELKQPFPDQDFDLRCPEVDVKGVFLTTSGYRTYYRDFVEPEPRLEIHQHSRREDLFGPLSLEEAEADKDNTLFARGQGFLTHLPAAILIPKKVVYQGQLIYPAELAQILHIPTDSQFALYVRAYPLSSTRSSDFFVWPEDPCILPHIWFPDTVFSPSPTIHCEDFINKVKFGRRVWYEIERPKLIKAFGVKDTKQFDRQYYQYVYQTVINQIAQVITVGISPCTGIESDDQNLHHTHIQNKTSVGAEIEWAPYTPWKQLAKENQLAHLGRLIEEYYDFLINTGYYCLNNWEDIPSFDQLIGSIIEIIGQNNELDQLRRDYTPTDTLEENDLEGIKRLKKSGVKIFKRNANEKILEDAKTLASQII